MKTLTLVRHAKAQDLSEDIEDEQRPLKESGLVDAAQLGARLHKQKLAPQLLLSSPAVRTLSTATILAGELRVPLQAIELEPQIYEAALEDLLDIVQTIDDEIENVLLVGHNPGISELASYLCKTALAPMPTSGVFTLNFEIEHWNATSKHSGNLA